MTGTIPRQAREEIVGQFPFEEGECDVVGRTNRVRRGERYMQMDATPGRRQRSRADQRRQRETGKPEGQIGSTNQDLATGATTI